VGVVFRRLRQKLSNLRRNLIYLSQQDYKRGLAFMLSEGRRLEHDAPNDLRHCPVCEAELGRTTRLNGEIVSYCPRWQVHPVETQPVIRQVPFPDVEAHTDKLASTVPLPGQRLAQYLQEHHTDAGPETTRHRAVQFPRPR
jgi:hypothetical protein